MGEPVIILIMVMVRIMYCVAAVVIVHICIHICLIMTQVMRPWTLEAAWVIVPMPRRSPRNVIMRVDMGVYAWSCPVYRSYYIIVAIYEWCSYNLNIVVRHRRTLHHNCSYILKYISAENCLDYKCMCVSVHLLHNSQIINISVSVEIQIGYHIGRIVEEHFEILHG